MKFMRSLPEMWASIFVAVGQLYLKRRVGQSFDHGTFQFDNIRFGHRLTSLK